jgi:predicted nucleic acid-binding protein
VTTGDYHRSQREGDWHQGASGGISEERLADAEREIEAVWARCEIWELTRTVCELARAVAPGKPLRTLDALHLATFLLARRRVEELELLTVHARLAEAAGIAPSIR